MFPALFKVSFTCQLVGCFMFSPLAGQTAVKLTAVLHAAQFEADIIFRSIWSSIDLSVSAAERSAVCNCPDRKHPDGACSKG